MGTISWAHRLFFPCFVKHLKCFIKKFSAQLGHLL